MHRDGLPFGRVVLAVECDDLQGYFGIVDSGWHAVEEAGMVAVAVRVADPQRQVRVVQEGGVVDVLVRDAWEKMKELKKILTYSRHTIHINFIP